MTLAETYEALRDALAPLGIEIESDVLAVWRDRAHHGTEPLPAEALKNLSELTARLLGEP